MPWAFHQVGPTSYLLKILTEYRYRTLSPVVGTPCGLYGLYYWIIMSVTIKFIIVAFCFQVSPQFDNTMCDLSTLKPQKRSQKGRKKRCKENEAPSRQMHKTLSLPALKFHSGGQSTGLDVCSKTGTRRYSKRIQEKKNRTHFLFEKPESQTPRLKGLKILAHETPEHKMPPAKEQSGTAVQRKK